MALALLLKVLGGLADTLGLVVDLLYPVIEEVLGKLEVALLERNRPDGQGPNYLLGGVGLLFGRLIDVLLLLLVHNG